MASIHKDPRGKSPYWLCYYTLPDGRRTSRSTKQRDRKIAWAFCLALERASEKAREGELTETTARQILSDILTSTGARALPHDTVRAFAERWLAAKAPGVTKPTARRYRQVVTAFLESLGPLADRSLQCVNATHIAAYRDQRLAISHVTRGTIGRDLASGVVTYTQAKTGKRVVVPIHPQLEEALLVIAGEKDGPLCPTLSRLATDGRPGLSNQFAELMRKADIDRREICLGKNTVARKTFHCLRHSFTSAGRLWTREGAAAS
jgi:integrase